MAAAASLPEALVLALREAARLLPGATAAFDADGTLWRDDVGEAFLRHLIELRAVQLTDGSDPYLRYEEAVARDRAHGFAFAAQLQAGIQRDWLDREAHAFAASWVPARLVPATRALVLLCAELGLRPRVVSASPIEIIRAAAPLAGIAAADCLGMTVDVRPGGQLTDRIVGPITYAGGKVAALAGAGWTPVALGAGDSITGDLALLECARVAVVVAPRGGSPLSAVAQQRGYAVLGLE